MENRDRVPTGAFFDKNEAARAANELLRATETFRRRLASSAFSAGDQESLLPVLASISDGFDKAVDDVRTLEEKELFGEEESYWTVFRFFCSEANRGTNFTIERIWEHLALSYDMSRESVESVAETIGEWAGDICEDAKLKLGIVGTFQQSKDGSFVFVYSQPVVETPPVRQRVSARKKTIEKQKTMSKEETIIRQGLSALLSESAPYIRQADLIKFILENNGDTDKEVLYDEINRLKDEGILYKFKITHRGGALLCTDESVVELYTVEKPEMQTTSPVDNNEGDKADLDIILADSILSNLVNSLSHVQQMKPTINLTQTFGQDVNATVRRLRAIGIVRIDRGSQLGGRRKELSKSKSKKVMRVGIINQTMKDQLKEHVQSGTLKEWLKSYIELQENEKI